MWLGKAIRRRMKLNDGMEVAIGENAGGTTGVVFCVYTPRLRQ